MRRLPIYFLIDVSESMVGAEAAQVEDGVQKLLETLRTDPQAMETVNVSIIVFAGNAKTLMPLQDIENVYPPRIPIGAGTSLSAGLNHLYGELEKNERVTTTKQKGDWKPIIFLLTDGVPTDDPASAISRFTKRWGRRTNLIAALIGDGGDATALRALTDTVLSVGSDLSDLSEFFAWVTDTIQLTSTSVETTGEYLDMADTDGTALSLIDLTKDTAKTRNIDERYIVLSAKCQNTSRPYLLKYKRRSMELHTMILDSGAYELVGGYLVDKSYEELSDGLGTGVSVNTNMLDRAPSCPSCSNPISFAHCACGGIHCIGLEGMATCPWCHNTAQYSTEENGGFDVERSQG